MTNHETGEAIGPRPMTADPAYLRHWLRRFVLEPTKGATLEDRARDLDALVGFERTQAARVAVEHTARWDLAPEGTSPEEAAQALAEALDALGRGS